VLAQPLRDRVAAALQEIAAAATPNARAFHAADVVDRVLQMRHYARAAAFTLDQALDDLDLVHPGPVQSFHHEVLAAAALPEGFSPARSAAPIPEGFSPARSAAPIPEGFSPARSAAPIPEGFSPARSAAPIPEGST